MGNKASVPQPGARLKVIGAGYARTGTASLSEALSILLDGPVYHGGTQITRGSPSTIRAWIRLFNHYPPKHHSDKSLILSTLDREFTGFVAATDAPAIFLVPELLELHPDALVICTVRDVAAWERSIGAVASLSTLWFLRVVLFPLPTMRHFVDYIDCLRRVTVGLYGEREPLTRVTWDGHIARLKEVVPADRLLFYDVREGWEPLCKFLGKEVPDMPFPRINDGEAIERMGKEMIMKGLWRWMGILVATGVAVAAWKMS